MNVRPFGKNIVVIPVKQDGKTAGGLIIPENEDQETMKGTVVGVGHDADPEIKEGQTVAYAKYSGNKIGEFLLIQDTDLLGEIISPTE